MKIIWKDIKNYEGIYQVSSSGLIQSLPRNYRPEAKILKTAIGVWGYPRIGLSKDNKMKNFPLAAIVAEAFLGPRPLMKVINHKDGNKSNNHIENLEYVSPRYNYLHAKKNNLFLIGPRRKLSLHIQQKILLLSQCGISAFAISKLIGFHYRTVLRFLKNK